MHFLVEEPEAGLWRDRVGVEHTGKDGGPIKQEAEFKVTPEDEAVIARIREKRDSIQKNS